MVINKEIIFIGGFVIALALLNKKIEANKFVNASGDKRGISGLKSDFSSLAQLRRLQKQFPYKGNEGKKWWKCGCASEGVGGCWRGNCLGPITSIPLRKN